MNFKRFKEDIWIILGPTASGKSALALDLALENQGEIINADSMQVYEDLPILSAHPTLAEYEKAPHHLYGILDYSQNCSAGIWKEQALATISALLSQNKVPILVGGTGLYIKALIEGLSPIPDIPLKFRKELEDLYNEIGIEGIRQELLKTHLPEVLPKDKQRLLRALEVYHFTGTPLYVWQTQPSLNPFPYSYHIILLLPPRDSLYHSVNQRVHRMISQGAIQEAQVLLNKDDLDPQASVLKTLGVASLHKYLKGEVSLEESILEIQQKSRQYAKRQVTWFRHQLTPQTVWNSLYDPSVWETFKKKTTQEN
jgi:tRNA dimethylallyltransferase